MSLPVRWRFTPLFGVLLLAGCASSNNIAPQSTLLDNQQLHLAQSKVSSLSISPQWWRSVNDPQLDTLMAETLENSPSLRQAGARVREAQSIVGETNAANGPYLDLNGSVNRQKISQNTFDIVGYPTNAQYENTNTLGLNLSYEFDWWGKYRNQVNAAKAQVNSARAEQQQAALTLTSTVAATYYQLQNRYALATVLQQEVDDNQRLADLRKAEYEAGISGIAVQRQTQAQTDGVKQQLVDLHSQIEQLKHQLAALAGKGPDAMNNLHPVPLPGIDQLAPQGNLTVDLLGKRPDIEAQRELVESYSQQIAVAKKDFYPSLSISAFGGFSTTDYGATHPNFFEAASQAWNIAPAISLPIFHAGALRSKLGEKSALYDEAVESYNQTILNAVQQTADAITIQKSSADQLQLASSAVQALKDAYRVMSDRYQAGTVGRDQLLDRQSQLLQQQQAEITASGNLLQAKISLIRALGGGYQAPAAESKS